MAKSWFLAVMIMQLKTAKIKSALFRMMLSVASAVIVYELLLYVRVLTTYTPWVFSLSQSPMWLWESYCVMMAIRRCYLHIHLHYCRWFLPRPLSIRRLYWSCCRRGWQLVISSLHLPQLRPRIGALFHNTGICCVLALYYPAPFLSYR